MPNGWGSAKCARASPFAALSFLVPGVPGISAGTAWLPVTLVQTVCRRRKRKKVEDGDPVEMVSTNLGTGDKKRSITGMYVRKNIAQPLMEVLHSHEQALRRKMVDSGISNITAPSVHPDSALAAANAHGAASLARGVCLLHHASVDVCSWFPAWVCSDHNSGSVRWRVLTVDALCRYHEQTCSCTCQGTCLSFRWRECATREEGECATREEGSCDGSDQNTGFKSKGQRQAICHN